MGDMRVSRSRAGLSGGVAMLAALSAVALSGPAAHAQQAEAAAASSAIVLEEIIVTAARRITSLQDTPLAVSVFSGATLEASRIDNPTDLQNYTPGLVVADYGVPQVFIRGVGSNTAGVGADASATIHIDGVYMARAYPAFMDFIDVDRVEVLRGPQGTLYGRNSTAGTINIITRKPSDTLTGEADLLYGADNRLRLRGAISGPILADDELSGRFSVVRETRDGLYTNVVNGKKLKDKDNLSLRGGLQWRPVDNLSFLLRGDNTRQRETGSVTKMLSTDPMLLAAGAIFPSDPFDVALDEDTHLNVDHRDRKSVV